MSLLAKLRPTTQEIRGPNLTGRLSSIQEALASISPNWQTVDFGDWLPDMPDLANPGATVARNVIPDKQSYRPFRALSSVSGALTAGAIGSTVARDTTGNNYNYAGDAAKLYEVRASGVTDKSKAGGYATASADAWRFTSFGETLVATNLTDAVQSITIGSTGLFADLITSTLTPKARDCATIREFLVLGHTNDATDGLVPHRIWWSGYRDATDFDPDSATQCDFEDRLSGGWVQRIIGGAEYGLVFQQRSIVRMSYTGGKAIFRFDEIDRTRGTPVANSVIGHGRLAFALSEQGFILNDGTQSYPIGEGKVDRTFWNQFDINNAHLVSAAIDPVNKIVAWAIPGKVFFYNWTYSKWSEAEIDLEILTNGTSEAYTLEELDAIALDSTADTTLDATEAAAQTILSVTDETLFDVGNYVRVTLDDASIHQSQIDSIGTGTITIADGLPSQATSGNRVVRTSIDALSASLDSPLWKGGGLLFGAFGTDHKLGYFTGDTLQATIETGEAEIHPGAMTKLSKLRPLIDGGMISVSVAGRNTQQAAITYGPAVNLDAIGEAGILDEHRYHRAKCTVAAGGTWTHAQGIQALANRAGQR